MVSIKIIERNLKETLQRINQAIDFSVPVKYEEGWDGLPEHSLLSLYEVIPRARELASDADFVSAYKLLKLTIQLLLNNKEKLMGYQRELSLLFNQLEMLIKESGKDNYVKYKKKKKYAGVETIKEKQEEESKDDDIVKEEVEQAYDEWFNKKQEKFKKSKKSKKKKKENQKGNNDVDDEEIEKLIEEI